MEVANVLDEDSENEEETELFTEVNAMIPVISTPVIPDDDLSLRIQSLNKKTKEYI